MVTIVVVKLSHSTYLCELSDVPEGEGIRVEGDQLPEPIAVFRFAGEYFAVSDTCSHADASLADGLVENCRVECPLHFAQFDLATGRACTLPAMDPITTYAITITDRSIHLRLPDEG